VTVTFILVISEATLPYTLRGKRHLAQPYACGIENGIRDGGCRCHGGRLARTHSQLVQAFSRSAWIFAKLALDF